MKVLILLLLPCFAAAWPRPQSGLAAEAEEDFPETEKCNSFQYREWIQNQISCEEDATSELDALLASFEFTKPQLRDEMCSATRRKIGCFDQRADECFDKERSKTVRLNLIFKEFKRFFNLTETLGEELIDNCAFMTAHERLVMDNLAGSNRCNFKEYERSRVKMQKCRALAKEARNFRLDLLPLSPTPREFLLKIVCRERADFLECSEPLKTCLGAKVRKSVESDEQEYFDFIGGQAVEIVPSFSFAKTCDSDGDAVEQVQEDDDSGVDSGLKLVMDRLKKDF